MNTHSFTKPQLIVEHAGRDRDAYVVGPVVKVENDSEEETRKWSSSTFCQRVYESRDVDVGLTIALLYLNDVSKEEYISYMMPVFKNIMHMRVKWRFSDHVFQHFHNNPVPKHFDVHAIQYIAHCQEGAFGRDAWTLTGKMRGDIYFHLIAESNNVCTFGQHGRVSCALAESMEELVVRFIPRSALWFMDDELRGAFPTITSVFEMPPCVVVNMHQNLRDCFRNNQVQYSRCFPMVIAAHRRIKSACWTIFRAYIQKKYNPSTCKVKELIRDHLVEDSRHCRELNRDAVFNSVANAIHMK